MIFPTVWPLLLRPPARHPSYLPSSTPLEKVARLSGALQKTRAAGWRVGRKVAAAGERGCKLKSSPFSRFLFSTVVLNQSHTFPYPFFLAHRSVYRIIPSNYPSYTRDLPTRSKKASPTLDALCCQSDFRCPVYIYVTVYDRK